MLYCDITQGHGLSILIQLIMMVCLISKAHKLLYNSVHCMSIDLQYDIKDSWISCFPLTEMEYLQFTCTINNDPNVWLALNSFLFIIKTWVTGKKRQVCWGLYHSYYTNTILWPSNCLWAHSFIDYRIYKHIWHFIISCMFLRQFTFTLALMHE